VRGSFDSAADAATLRTSGESHLSFDSVADAATRRRPFDSARFACDAQDERVEVNGNARA